LLPAARHDTWESYHSDENPGLSVYLPSREIADAFRLCSQPQTFDLFEGDGRRATVSVTWGDLWTTGHSLVYVRKDLLDDFLLARRQRLVRLIAGQRTYAPGKTGDIVAYYQKHHVNGRYQEVVPYGSSAGARRSRVPRRRE
jgi:hypothetical protein